MQRALVLLGVGLSLLVSTTGHTQNRLIPFQGKLTATGGSQIPDGNSSITFRIWDHPTDTAPARLKWTEPRTVFVQDGQVNLMLGTVTSLDSFDFSPPNVFYLGISVGAGAEMAPRQQLVPSFHARSADVAKNVPDNSVSTNAIQSNAINSSRIADGEVKAADIGNGEIVSAKIASNAVDSSKIADQSITAADIAPGVIPGPPFVLQAIVLSANGGISIPFQASHSQITNAALSIVEVTPVPSGANLAIPCSSGASIGSDCGATTEAVGIVFDPPRNGMYEVCADSGVFLQTAPLNGFVGWEIKLIQTQNTSTALIRDPDFHVERSMNILYAAKIDEVHQRSAPLRICELFQLTGGIGSKATFRLVGRTKGSGSQAELTHSESQNDGLVKFTIKELR